MPCLQAFGRRWYIGSDDLVVPAFFDVVTRGSWIIGAISLYFCNVQKLKDCELGGNVTSMIHSVLAAVTVNAIADIMIVHCSKKGGIMDVEERNHVPTWIYIRCILWALELPLVTYITLVKFQGKKYCELGDLSESLITAFLITNWTIFIATLIAIYVVYNCVGGYDYTISSKGHEVLRKAWYKRLKWLMWRCCFPSNYVKEVILETSAVFASGFEDKNLVLTDVIAGLYLSRLKRKDEPVETEKKTFDYSFLFTGDWRSIDVIEYYSELATACYSYGLVLLKKVSSSKSRPLLRITCKECVCCSCLPCRKVPWTTKGDNCCFLNNASAKALIHDFNAELVYTNFEDKIHKVPFLVLVDFTKKTIVVATRGTMSFADAITDMHCPYTTMPDMPENFLFHKGMLCTALNVKEELDKIGIIPELKEKYPGFDLVFTGQSLGASVASLLCMMFRKTYPEAVAYAFATSGALMNLPASKYCEDFIVSVVYGCDLVTRLSPKSMEVLFYEIMIIMHECDTPKYRIFLSMLKQVFGFKSTVTFNKTGTFQRDDRIYDINREQAHESLISTVNHSLSQENVKISEATVPTKMMRKVVCGKTSTCTYPSGRVLHIEEEDRNKFGNLDLWKKSRWKATWCDKNDEKFRRIIVSSRVIADHFPLRYHKALLFLSEKVALPLTEVKIEREGNFQGHNQFTNSFQSQKNQDVAKFL